MAAGEHRSRFRCQTIARIFAASVVALAFAAAMVVVLPAGLSPDNARRLSVTHGHIQSAGLLWSSKDFEMGHVWRQHNETTVYYTPAEELTMWVSMDVHDPTHRAALVCVADLHVLDMPHAPFFDGMVDIATVDNTVATGNARKPCAPWRRSESASRMQLDRWVTVNDPLMLCYISQKYGGFNDFTVMVRVDMTIFYLDEGVDSRPANYTTYYCWPVTIGNTRRIRSEAVTCKPSQDIIDFFASHTLPVLRVCDLTPRQRQLCKLKLDDPQPCP